METFFLVDSCFGNMAATHRNKTAIIGAGAAGLAAIKALKEESEDGCCVCFEFKSSVGGTWLEASGEEKSDDALFFASPIYKNWINL